MGYVDGTSAIEMLDNVFEVLEGGKSVEAAKVTELIADNGAKICDITSYTTNAANGAAAEVGEVVNIEAGAAAGTTTGAGILAMDVGAAGAAIAPALGILAGVGLYNLAPEFWTNVADKLTQAGYTVKGKVIGFIDNQGITSFPKPIIELFKDAFINAHLFEADNFISYPEGSKLSHPLDFPDAYVFPLNGVNGLVTCTHYSSNPYQTDHTEGYKIVSAEGLVTSVLMCAQAADGIFWSVSLDPFKVVTTKQPSGWSDTETDAGTIEVDGVTYYIYGKAYITGAPISANSIPKSFFSFDYIATYPLPANYSAADIVRIIFYGVSKIIDNRQEGAIYPEPGIEFPQTYPEWQPAQFPEPLPQEIPEPYPVALPEPDIVQDPAQSGENQNEAQQDQLLNIFYNTLPDPRPHILPDLDPSIEPEPEPAPQPEPQPNPTDPNPDPSPSGLTPILPTLQTTSASRMFTVYNPTDGEVNSLGAFLWTSNIIEQIKKMWDNPMDGIISFHKIYGAPVTGSTKNIIMGYIDSGVSALEVTSQFTEVDCGTVTVPERLHNATDYSPFTSIHLYLPFIGIVEIDTNEVMNAELHIKYRIDVYTGTCVALIYARRGADMPNEQIIYTFSGNASQKLPLTAADFSGAIGALLGLAGAGVAVASGGALGVAAGALGAAHSLTSEMVHVQHSGGLSANAGILSPRKPFMILSRQYGYDANGYSGFYGYPANKTVYIGNCNGYIKCKDVIFRGSCTEEEVNEIISLLKGGVYL